MLKLLKDFLFEETEVPVSTQEPPLGAVDTIKVDDEGIKEQQPSMGSMDIQTPQPPTAEISLNLSDTPESGSETEPLILDIAGDSSTTETALTLDHILGNSSAHTADEMLIPTPSAETEQVPEAPTDVEMRNPEPVAEAAPEPTVEAPATPEPATKVAPVIESEPTTPIFENTAEPELTVEAIEKQIEEVNDAIRDQEAKIAELGESAGNVEAEAKAKIAEIQEKARAEVAECESKMQADIAAIQEKMAAHQNRLRELQQMPSDLKKAEVGLDMIKKGEKELEDLKNQVKDTLNRSRNLSDSYSVSNNPFENRGIAA
jgi:ElaB/YqjD/DUF883 family membrane-anchored ribosome-binding protein